MKKYYLFLALFMVLSLCRINAQNKSECIICKGDTLIRSINLYGGFVHQHQDFFNKAFSFQGIEAGVILNHRLLLGGYGSTFVSNLAITLSNEPAFVNIAQAGLLIGTVKNNWKIIHTGWLLNVGYFSLKSDKSDFALFKPKNSSTKINGLILSPQVYAEANITRWMRFRTGIAYSFYSFQEQSIITKTELQNISLNFGFIFGK